MSVLNSPWTFGHLYLFAEPVFFSRSSQTAFSGASNSSSDHGLPVSLVVCTAVVQCMLDYFLSISLFVLLPYGLSDE